MDDQWKPRTLVLGPGGVKGLMILGCLVPLEDNGILSNIDTYCGVSIGAIISLLLVIGYNVRSIVSHAADLAIFKDLFCIDLKKSLKHKGLMSNEPARQKLSQFVLNKLGSIPNLYDLYMMTGKSLITVALNVTDEVTEYFTPFTCPTLSCIDAVMYSMNVPFIYYQLIDSRGKTMIDGAFANPYPVDYVDNKMTDVLGIYIKTIYNQPINTLDYLHKLLESTLIQRRKMAIDQSSPRCKHIGLCSNQLDFTGVMMNVNDKAKMIVDGYNTGKVFLTQEEDRDDVVHHYHYPTYYVNQNDSV